MPVQARHMSIKPGYIAVAPPTCGTPMRHRHGGVSPCVLPKNHFVTDEDSCHRDEHGHTARVLVRQSSVRELEALEARP